ncbi:MAG: hypothetical protein ACFFEY_00600 [Candidatus Thorarchaeota archaeon]
MPVVKNNAIPRPIGIIEPKIATTLLFIIYILMDDIIIRVAINLSLL